MQGENWVSEVAGGYGTVIETTCHLFSKKSDFQQIDIYETRTGISLCASFNGVKFCEIKDITVRNVKFSGLAAFWIFNDWTGKFANRNGKKCSNILVENFTGIQTNGSMIIGNADYGMRDLVFKNVHIKQTENRQKSDINADPDIFRRAWDVPCVIYFRNVNGLELKESTFTGVPELKDVCINVLNRI